ncbi:TraG/VirB4 family ATPase [Paenibacillus sp. y28]|uniref:TraG/VirB4 family ATPase n=1 Tax=Paenibacillus sp. y28 TaxID=3129110 RepID=UPI003015A77E
MNPILDGKDVTSGHYVRVIAIAEYPPTILAGYLDQLDKKLRTHGAILKKTVRYAPANLVWNQSMINKLKRLEQNMKQATTYEPGRREEQDAYHTILALRDSQTNDNRILIDVWTYLTIAAPKKHQLDAATEEMKTWFGHLGGELDTLKREQVEAMRQTSPLHDPDTDRSEFFTKTHYGRAAMDTAAARTYPMTRGSFSDHKGLYAGRRTEDGGFCFINLCDPNDSRAQNVTVFGKTGEGKSFFLKALVVSLIEEGVHVFVFDLTGEWRAVCEEVGGVYVDHSSDNGRYFEPMSIMPALPEMDEDCIRYNRGRYFLAIQSTIRTFSLLADGLSKEELFEVGEAIRRVYARAGIYRDRPETWDHFEGPKPTIHAVFEEIRQEKEQDNPDAKSVFGKVKLYFIGVYDGMFRIEEPPAYHRVPLVVYKVGEGTSDDNKKDENAKQSQIKMSMAFDMVNSNIQMLKYEGASFSAVLVDEGQRQAKNPEMLSAIFAWYTTIRQWNGMMILGANTPDIMLENAAGRGCWENTSVRVYFFMEHSAVRSLGKEADIPIEIQQRIAKNKASRRYVLEYHGSYDELIMDVPDEEAALYRTRGLKVV